jgi:hypothetical protein
MTCRQATGRFAESAARGTTSPAGRWLSNGAEQRESREPGRQNGRAAARWSQRARPGKGSQDRLGPTSMPAALVAAVRRLPVEARRGWPRERREGHGRKKERSYLLTAIADGGASTTRTELQAQASSVVVGVEHWRSLLGRAAAGGVLGRRGALGKRLAGGGARAWALGSARCSR